MKQKAIFLDRDGVLNQAVVKNGKPFPPATLNELIIPSDVLPALTQLKSQGYLLIGATNQPDVARGLTKREWVEAINQTLMQHLPLDKIYVCYHDDADQCTCRKPEPGLLLQAAAKYNLDLQQSVMIGDRWKDILAGEKAGCKTVWINHGYQEQAPARADFIVSSMKEAANCLLPVGP